MSNLSQGLMLTIIGMGVVFFSLAILATLIILLERSFGRGSAKIGARTEVPASRRATAEERGSREPKGEDVGHVLAAAAAYFLEGEAPSIFIAPPKRPSMSPWAQQSRADALRSGGGP